MGEDHPDRHDRVVEVVSGDRTGGGEGEKHRGDSARATPTQPPSELHLPRCHGPGLKVSPASRRSNVATKEAMVRPMTEIEIEIEITAP